MVFDDCIVNGCVISVYLCCRGNIFCYVIDIYIKNRVGPRTEPFGTPACVSRKDELEP